MSRIRRFGAIMAVTAFAAGSASSVAATPAGAATRNGPKPLVSAVSYVESGTPTWVRMYWTSPRDICDAKVTVLAKNVGIVYPENTETYTSFRRNATLATGRADYTAFNVSAESATSKVVKLTVTIRYTELPKGTLRPGVDPEAIDCKGREKARLSTVKLPVIGERDL